ncbi:Myoferlin, partial [Fasciola gigantica]
FLGPLSLVRVLFTSNTVQAREYSCLPDRFEALNLGKGEGVAYRGRVLLELTTELLEDPVKNEVRPLEADVIARIQKSLRRRKYKLFAAFFSASMISEEKDSAIAFEVSIGNHGNMLEDSVAPCASTTPPTNPVYDGEAYSYLPWGDDKPCTVVDSQWEDISYRLCAVNMFLKIADRLTKNIEKISVAVVAALIPEEQAQLAIASLDEFILDCTRPLPTWEPENSPETELDKQLRRVREHELKALRDHAMKTRETVVSVDEALTQLKAYRDVILNLATEPQRSFPDIVIWMLSGNRRAAYHRIPAHEILYHTNEDFRGRSCGITQNIILKKPRLSTDEENGFWKIPAQIRVIFWLGLEKEQSKWKEIFTAAKLQVVAETDTGQSSYIEDLFYNETRTTANSWTVATPTYTNAQGEPKETPEDFPLADGWQWDDQWRVDYNRPCDDEGFEYTVNAKQGGYVAVEKMYHTFRRRRIIRRRVPKNSVAKCVEETVANQSTEHWEYAFNFESAFHANEHKVDMARRRRWHRGIRPVDGKSAGTTCVMQLSAPGSSMIGKLVVPRVYLCYSGRTYCRINFNPLHAYFTDLFLTRSVHHFSGTKHYLGPHTWHLRAYLFQARGLLGADDTGLSDPYVRCSFQGLTQRTETITATLCPTWDETLIFEEVQIYGDPMTTAICPPPVIVEIFDWDNLSSDHFLGRCQVSPLV